MFGVPGLDVTANISVLPAQESIFAFIIRLCRRT